ncbi:MAG: hypothetical protein DBX47_00465 [Clostridiales bacterium]|nr:MAG: hypothetical protein DBX47_00465 [Clostridiales bacterium]
MYNKHIETDCIYCKYGYTLKNGEHTACDKLGLLNRRFKCGKFKYDPLKRIPSLPVNKVSYDAQDFKL